MKMDSKSKTPKYWYQSTGRGLKNDRTIRPTSGLKRKPCILSGDFFDTSIYLTNADCRIEKPNTITKQNRDQRRAPGTDKGS